MTDNRGDTETRPLGRPPNVDGAQTRARLLDAALELFARQGFSGTSIREIAEAVGIRDSAIYSHFDSKQALYEALLERAGPGLPRTLAMDPEALAGQHPATAIPELVHRLVAAWDEPDARRFTSLMIREGLVGLADALADVRTQFAATFAHWVDEGLVRDDVPHELLAWEFTGPLATIRLVFLRADSSEPQRERGRQLADRHGEYFVKTAVTDAPQGPDGPPRPARGGGR